MHCSSRERTRAQRGRLRALLQTRGGGCEAWPAARRNAKNTYDESRKREAQARCSGASAGGAGEHAPVLTARAASRVERADSELEEEKTFCVLILSGASARQQQNQGRY